MKRFFVIFAAFFTALFLPHLTFADLFHPDLLNPPPIQFGTDVSIMYLSDIFGVVDGVLHGSGSQIMGQMFGVFNAGALVLGGIIIMYTLVLGTLQTAHEGEALGRNWSSLWIPVRSVLGVALLLPRATGYSTIQIIMMWAIVQGVAIADSIWDAVLKYLASGGVIVQQQLIPNVAFAGSAGDILRAQTCMYAVQAALQTGYQAQKAAGQNVPPPPILAPDNPLETPAPFCPGISGICIQFPGRYNGFSDPMYANLSGVCGHVVVSPVNLGSMPGADMMQQYILTAVNQLIVDTSGPAQAIVNAQLRIGNDSSNTQKVSDVVDPKTLLNAAMDYQGILQPISRAMLGGGGSNPVLQLLMATAAMRGWILAGSYYDIITQSNNNIQAVFMVPPDTTNVSIASMPTNLANLSSQLPSWAGQYIDPIKAMFAVSSPLNTYIGAMISVAYAAMAYYGVQSSNVPIPAGMTGALGDVLSVVLGPIVGGLVTAFMGLVGLASAQITNADPIVMIATIGNGLITAIVGFWIEGAIVAGALAMVMGSIPCVTISSVVNDVIMWILPLVWAVLGFLFAEACLMVFYIPLIPFILFTFGAIGWITAVIEAMVAAPLIALGITHPEGSPILGKADPAVLLLVNVFMRPSMMVIGFIGGIILTYVGVWLFNQGFFTMLFGYLLQDISGASWLLVIPAILVLYVTIVIIIVNQAMALIYLVPDRVMRWIGGQEESIGGRAKEALGEVKGKVSEGAGAVGKGATEASQAAGKGAQKRGAGAAEGGGEGSNQIQSGNTDSIQGEPSGSGAAGTTPTTTGSAGGKAGGGGGSAGAGAGGMGGGAGAGAGGMGGGAGAGGGGGGATAAAAVSPKGEIWEESH